MQAQHASQPRCSRQIWRPDMQAVLHARRSHLRHRSLADAKATEVKSSKTHPRVSNAVTTQPRGQKHAGSKDALADTCVDPRCQASHTRARRAARTAPRRTPPERCGSEARRLSAPPVPSCSKSPTRHHDKSCPDRERSRIRSTFRRCSCRPHTPAHHANEKADPSAGFFLIHFSTD